MNYLFINHSVPSRHANGGPASIYALIEAAIDAGHIVSVIAIIYGKVGVQESAYIKDLGKLGAEVFPFCLHDENQTASLKLKGLNSGTIFFKVTWKAFCNRDSLELAQLVDDIKPDKVICYHWDSIALASNISKYCVVGLLGDPINAPAFRQNKHLLFGRGPVSIKLIVRFGYFLLLNFLANRAMRYLLSRCRHLVSFQYGECSLYKRLGFNSVDYLPTPISDLVAEDRYRLTSSAQANSRFRVLLGPSNLNATVTRAGLTYFCDSILPSLLARYGENFFEFRIVGEGSAAGIFSCHINKPYLSFTGRIEPPDEEFLNADLQLSLTPFRLGNRVRVSTGMMYGCPIVVSSCEAFNILELKHGINCLIGRDAREIVSCIIDIIEYPGLRDSLAKASRKSYEDHNNPSIVWSRLTESFNDN